MLRIFLTILILFVFLSTFVVAQDEVERVKEKLIPPKSTVRGRIVYEDNGLPVRRGLIGLLNIDELPKDTKTFVNQSIGPEMYVLTDDDGSFEFANVAAGAYYPSVNVPNVVNPQSINSYFGNNSTISSVKLDQFFKKIETDGISPVIVYLTVKRGASISGRVVYSDMQPAIGREVRLIREGEARIAEKTSVYVKRAMTDDRGWFRLTELPPGSYRLYVSEPADHRVKTSSVDDPFNFSKSELKVFNPQTSDPAHAKTIELDWGQVADGIDIQIRDRRLFRVSGTVLPNDQKGPRGKFWVSFENAEPERSESGTNQVETDAEGNFGFKDLPPGKYRLRASACQSYSCRWSDPAGGSDYADTVKEFTIEDADVSGLDIEMRSGVTISGSVTLEGKKPVPSGTTIWLFEPKNRYEASRSFYARDSADAAPDKWDFEFKRVPEGKLQLMVRAGNEAAYVERILLVSRDVTNDPIEVKQGQNIADLKVVLSTEMGTLRGTVTKEKETVPLALVLLIPVDKKKRDLYHQFFNGFADRDGRFEIKAAPGDYFIIFPTKSADVRSDEEMKALLKDAPKVTVSVDKVTEVKLELK